MHNHSYGNEFYLHRNKTIVFISMVNCELGLVMKLKRFSRACKWPTECWILALSFLLLILHTCNTPLEITFFFSGL